MLEPETEPRNASLERETSIRQSRVPGIALVVLALCTLVSGVLVYSLWNRVQVLETKLQKAQEDQAKLNDNMERAQSQMQASAQMLGQKLGLTQKQISQRAAEILKQQRAEGARFAQQQQQQEAKLGAVSENVAGVKTEVGGVKNELEETRAKLERTIGDLGIQSGLIATTHDELELLKHRGDRNYYEFTLQKSKATTPVSTVSLQLKKADVKHARYTLVVTSDDKQIEKKDRGLNEPVQFYTGRDKLLYELVVNAIDKNRVTGYISTPKGAPQPVEKGPSQ